MMMLRNERKSALALTTMTALLGGATLLATSCNNGINLPPPLTTTTSSATTDATSSTASAGGAGGATASSGSGGSGGGPAVTCLDASTIADVLTLEDDTLCAVARYDAAEALGFNAPSWGAHGGPLTLHAAMDNTFDLVRWTPPAGATGALTKKATHVDGMVPMGAFLGNQAVDLPFFGWTAIVWTGAFPDVAGEILLVKGGAVEERYATAGAYATAGIAAANAQGRLLLTGLSTIGDKTAGANGLYAADTCGTAAMPALVPGQDASCKAPIGVAAWGDASGPVVADHDGNAFVIMSSFDGTQEARGFDAASIARGAGPTAGTKLFTLPGFGSNLAALAPTSSAPGLVVFQPTNGTTYKPEDVIEQPYTTTGGKLAAVGAPKTMIKAATLDAFLYVMVDAQERLWVGTDTTAGATYVVLARKP